MPDLPPEAEGADPGICVDRCLCFGQSFAHLREVAERTGAASVEALQQHVAFGRSCGRCRPYVRRMLRTGETVFRELLSEDVEPPEMAGS